MNTTTKDINTDTLPAPETIVITDDKNLSDLVYEAASLQLILNAAEAKQQAALEAAKKAFADATHKETARIVAIFAAVETYAATNRDRLFPAKKGKRAKTYAILQHKLQYRSSDSVDAPSNAVGLINQHIEAAKSYFARAPEGYLWNGMTKEQLVSGLKALIRVPDPELNKDALKAANEHLLGVLHLNGIRIRTAETFKLAFTFTPTQA